MSSNEYAAPLRLEFRHSPGLILVFSLIHLGVLPTVAMIQAPLGVKVAIAAAVLFSLGRSLLRHGLRWSPAAVKGLVWQNDGQWQLERADGRVSGARLLNNAYVHPRLAILNFALEGSQRQVTVLVTPDGLRVGSFRQLRVRLRLAAGSLAEQAQY